MRCFICREELILGPFSQWTHVHPTLHRPVPEIGLKESANENIYASTSVPSPIRDAKLHSVSVDKDGMGFVEVEWADEHAVRLSKPSGFSPRPGTPAIRYTRAHGGKALGSDPILSAEGVL